MNKKVIKKEIEKINGTKLVFLINKFDKPLINMKGYMNLSCFSLSWVDTDTQ